MKHWQFWLRILTLPIAAFLMLVWYIGDICEDLAVWLGRVLPDIPK